MNAGPPGPPPHLFKLDQRVEGALQLALGALHQGSRCRRRSAWRRRRCGSHARRASSPAATLQPCGSPRPAWGPSPRRLPHLDLHRLPLDVHSDLGGHSDGLCRRGGGGGGGGRMSAPAAAASGEAPAAVCRAAMRGPSASCRPQPLTLANTAELRGNHEGLLLPLGGAGRRLHPRAAVGAAAAAARRRAGGGGGCQLLPSSTSCMRG